MKIDPRVKLIYILLLTSLAILAKDIIYISTIVLVSIVVNICLKTDIIKAIKRISFYVSFIIFITLVQSMAVKGGTPLIYIGTFVFVSTTGIIFAVEFLLRMLVIILSGIIATSTDGREMADGMQKMGIPYEFVFMSGIALRFFPIFSDEFRARLNAITMRGINIKKLPFRKKIKLYVYLLAPTISGCILRSEQLAVSIEARGFRALEHRTMFRELKMRPIDWVVLVIGLVLAGGFLFCNYYIGSFVAIA
ncbi:MAG: energy-coupling factor transporter transmembrane protein EcfT [Clostridiales bacterium]|jgi:energy-coupling factor transport system permease protein|nr:energy-coupling factor transporter transmembrane protein EcfT [Clostridiales bacterium]